MIHFYLYIPKMSLPQLVGSGDARNGFRLSRRPSWGIFILGGKTWQDWKTLNGKTVRGLRHY